jgi:hypothetical protein
MRYQRFLKIVITCLIFLGISSLIISILAHPLGLAKTNLIGRKHLLLAAFGLFCIFLSFFWKFWPFIQKSSLSSKAHLSFQKIEKWLRSFTLYKWFLEIRRQSQQSKIHHWFINNPYVWILISSILVLTIYFFFNTGGKWVFHSSSGYYDRLANAFIEGSVALLEKPPAALASLADPYRGNRAGIDYLWDTSYYQGKYYLYWGPVPSLLAAAIKVFHQFKVSNSILVFVFLCVMALIMASIFHLIRSNYFPNSPGWTTGFFTLVTMLSLPTMWLINHSGVYEVAITGGQFFLMLGLFSALRGMVSSKPNLWLVIAGFAWGASVGSRATNLFAIAWMVLILLIYFYKETDYINSWFLSISCLCLPFITWGIGLGWYNYARFGSFFETGYRYQLTNQGAWAPNLNNLFSPSFIYPNIYNYLFRPVIIEGGRFPFFITPFIDDPFWPHYIKLPPDYLSREPVAGILLTVPIFLLVMVLILKPIEKTYRWIMEKPQSNELSFYKLKWVWWLIFGASIAAVFVTSSFFFSTMRYIADFFTLFMIFLAMCIWWGLDFLKNTPKWRGFLITLILVLGFIGMIIGIFGSLNDPYSRIKSLNPELYSSLENFFQIIIH